MQWGSNAQKSVERLIHGIRPSNTMTVGDVYHTLCKQKETLTHATNGERNTLNRLLNLPFIVNKVRTFALLTIIYPKKFLHETVDHPSAIQPPEA